MKLISQSAKALTKLHGKWIRPRAQALFRIFDVRNFDPLFRKFKYFKELAETDIEEEIFEWIDLFESVYNAKDQFTMVEVGAGLGRWSIRGAQAAKFRKLHYHLVLVEAEPFRAHVGIHQEMQKNNIPSASYQIFDVGVGAVNAKSYFYVSKGEQTLDNWLGQCIVPDHDPIVQVLQQEHDGRPLVQTQYGYVATGIEQRKFSEILNAIESPIIDLCDFDIQGSEFDVIQESIDILNHRVKRLHIGTHSHEIETKLRNLLSSNHWQLIRDYPLAQANETEFGQIKFVDGVQTWHNKRWKSPYIYSFSQRKRNQVRAAIYR